MTLLSLFSRSCSLQTLNNKLERFQSCSLVYCGILCVVVRHTSASSFPRERRFRIPLVPIGNGSFKHCLLVVGFLVCFCMCHPKIFCFRVSPMRRKKADVRANNVTSATTYRISWPTDINGIMDRGNLILPVLRSSQLPTDMIRRVEIS